MKSRSGPRYGASSRPVGTGSSGASSSTTYTNGTRRGAERRRKKRVRRRGKSRWRRAHYPPRRTRGGRAGAIRLDGAPRKTQRTHASTLMCPMTRPFPPRTTPGRFSNREGSRACGNRGGRITVAGNTGPTCGSWRQSGATFTSRDTADYAPLLKHHEDFADETDTWPTGCSRLEDRVTNDHSPQPQPRKPFSPPRC